MRDFAACRNLLLKICEQPQQNRRVFRIYSEVINMRYNQKPFLRRGIRLDPALCTVQLFQHQYRLTQQEYLLFDQLLRSAIQAEDSGAPMHVLSRDELLCGAWGSAVGYETRTVDVHVQRLRAKMGSDLITTVYRKGYCINPSVLSRLALS